MMEQRNRASAAECKVDTCERAVHAKGYCSTHYNRVRLYGDPLVRPHDVAPFVVRFWGHVLEDGPLPRWAPFLGPCWIWTGSTSPSTGYGVCNLPKGGNPVAVREYAHRMSWVLHWRLPVPPGHQIDHLCRVRMCVRPSHLEAVTQQENISRSDCPSAVNARKTHCIHGHEFTPENTYHPPKRPHVRQCIACDRERQRSKRST